MGDLETRARRKRGAHLVKIGVLVLATAVLLTAVLPHDLVAGAILWLWPFVAIVAGGFIIFGLRMTTADFGSTRRDEENEDSSR